MNEIKIKTTLARCFPRYFYWVTNPWDKRDVKFNWPRTPVQIFWNCVGVLLHQNTPHYKVGTEVMYDGSSWGIVVKNYYDHYAGTWSCDVKLKHGTVIWDEDTCFEPAERYI